MIFGPDNIATEIEEKGDILTVKHIEDIRPVLKDNYEARKYGMNGFNKEHNYRKIGSIPFLVWLEWANKYPELLGLDRELQEKRIRKLLRDPENALYRTVDKGI